MITTLDDDIYEYSQTLEKLQNENQALKMTLRRHMLYGNPGHIDNLDSYSQTQQLHEMEQMFDLMFHSLLVPAFAGEIINDDNNQVSDFVFTKVNKQFADYFHLEIKDILGKTNSRLNILKSKSWIDSIATTCKILDTNNTEIQNGDDTINATFISTKHDQFIAHFVVNNCIGSAKSTDVMQNLKLTQTMINAIPTPLFYKDMEGRYLLCNKSYAKSIVGVSPETITGKTALQLEDIFPKEYADFYQEKDTELINGEGIQTYQGPIKCADGIVREYIVNKTIIKDSNGNFTGILGVMQDIDGLLKARRELALSEMRYKTLFNGIQEPIIVVDNDGNIVMLNKSAVQLFEIEEDTAMNSSSLESPAQKLINMDLIRQIYKTGETLTNKIKIVSKGQEYWYYCTMQIIDDIFGEKVVQIMCNDITELTHYQAELIEQKQRAEESNNLKSVFLANIAHETRTPASIITGLAQLIKQGANQTKHNEYLNTIFINCRRLISIIDDIVELSEIETGQIKLRHEICSINNIIEVAFVNLQDALKESGKSIKLTCSEPVNEYKSLIYADNLLISKALNKLISNAVTFTQQGEISIGAEIDDDEFLTFYVKDTGIGIPQSKLNVIFERFRQADEGESRQYGGTGLGLSIVNQLVKAMNGVVSVESRENEGSTFRFSIPYERA